MSQHLDALARGNRVRVAAAELRTTVRSLPAAAGAERSAEILLYDETEAAGALWADELLLCVHRYGTARVEKLLRSVGVRGRRRLRELTPRQRGALADLLLDARRTA